jgi:hypothetical protein
MLCEFGVLFISPNGVYVFSVMDPERMSHLSDIFKWAFATLRLIYNTPALYVPYFASRFLVVFNRICSFVCDFEICTSYVEIS